MTEVLLWVTFLERANLNYYVGDPPRSYWCCSSGLSAEKNTGMLTSYRCPWLNDKISVHLSYLLVIASDFLNYNILIFAISLVQTCVERCHRHSYLLIHIQCRFNAFTFTVCINVIIVIDNHNALVNSKWASAAMDNGCDNCPSSNNTICMVISRCL